MNPQPYAPPAGQAIGPMPRTTTAAALFRFVADRRGRALLDNEALARLERRGMNLDRVQAALAELADAGRLIVRRGSRAVDVQLVTPPAGQKAGRG